MKKKRRRYTEESGEEKNIKIEALQIEIRIT
jgi:hypothetical protein